MLLGVGFICMLVGCAKGMDTDSKLKESDSYNPARDMQRYAYKYAVQQSLSGSHESSREMFYDDSFEGDDRELAKRMHVLAVAHQASLGPSVKLPAELPVGSSAQVPLWRNPAYSQGLKRAPQALQVPQAPHAPHAPQVASELPAEMQALQSEYKASGTKQPFSAWLETEFSSLQDIKKKRFATRKERWAKTQNVIGRAAMMGFAGKNGVFIKQDIPISFTEGIMAGVACRIATVAGDKFERFVESDVLPAAGGLWAGFARHLSNAWYWLFNGSVRPYNAKHIQNYREEVKNVIFNKLSQSALNATQSGAEGYGTRSRVQSKFDFALLAKGVDDMQDEEAGEQDLTWQALVAGLARDLDRITLRLEVPKAHYAAVSARDEQDMVVDGRADILDLATRIQETLQILKTHILQPTRTLKDLASGDLKAILPRLETEIDQRFQLFINALTMYHSLPTGKQATTSSSSAYEPRSSYKSSALDMAYGGGI